MKTTLTCAKAGLYRVLRRPDHWEGPVTLRAKSIGWEIVFHGPGGFARLVGGFGTFAEARAWLVGPAGQAWLDALPRAEVDALKSVPLRPVTEAEDQAW